MICALLARGKSLNEICLLDEMPAESTVRAWALDLPAFSAKYARARELQADCLAEQIIAVAFDDSKDLSGELQMPNSAAVNRSRLKVDALKWFASKVAPKKYGDRVELAGELALKRVVSDL